MTPGYWEEQSMASHIARGDHLRDLDDEPTPAHTWIETIRDCEVCGEHDAIYCPECDEYVDLAYQDDPRETA